MHNGARTISHATAGCQPCNQLPACSRGHSLRLMSTKWPGPVQSPEIPHHLIRGWWVSAPACAVPLPSICRPSLLRIDPFLVEGRRTRDESRDAYTVTSRVHMGHVYLPLALTCRCLCATSRLLLLTNRCLFATCCLLLTCTARQARCPELTRSQT